MAWRTNSGAPDPKNTGNSGQFRRRVRVSAEYVRARRAYCGRRVKPTFRSRLAIPRSLQLAACLLLGALAPSAALAHVKWFTDPTAYPLRTDLVLSDRTLLCLIGCTLAVAQLVLLQRRFGSSWRDLPLLRRMSVGAPTILGVQAAIALTAAAAQSTLLAPNLRLPDGPLGMLLAALEVSIAFTFITGIADWLGALALIGLVPAVALVGQPLDVLEQFFWVGIGVTTLVIGRGSSAGQRARPWFLRRDPAWANRAVACLRVATGVALIAVALGEKLWNPELGRAFMASHPAFNVLHAVLGPDLGSDDLFVLLIGLGEAAIGAALISGRLTRLVVLGMWLPFHLGIPLLPDQELIGHLPIFGIMYVLLVHGAQPSVATAPRSVPARKAAVATPTARWAIPTAGRPPHRLLRGTPVGYSTSRPAARRANLAAFGASRGRSTTHAAAASKTN
jgi:hypothetical protein